jgi:hypothetical protein
VWYRIAEARVTSLPAHGHGENTQFDREQSGHGQHVSLFCSSAEGLKSWMDIVFFQVIFDVDSRGYVAFPLSTSNMPHSHWFLSIELILNSWIKLIWHSCYLFLSCWSDFLVLLRIFVSTFRAMCGGVVTRTLFLAREPNRGTFGNWRDQEDCRQGGTQEGNPVDFFYITGFELRALCLRISAKCVCWSAFCHWDKMPETLNLWQGSFLLSHSSGGSSPWSVGPRVTQNVMLGSTWQRKSLHFMVGQRCQYVLQGHTP